MTLHRLWVAVTLYDFEHQVRFIDEHADFLHIDIKDGNYVQNFGVGPEFYDSIEGQSCKKADGCTLNGEASTRLH